MKYLLAVIGFIFFLNSCATIPKPLESVSPSQEATGVFKAKTNARNIDGFFRISSERSVIDIVSPLGFALYGIYINGNNIYVKDYLSGAKFTNADLEKLNIPKKDSIFFYEDSLIYFTQNFFSMCSNNQNSNIRIVECKDINGIKLPTNVEFVHAKDLLKLTFDKYQLQSASTK